MSDILFDIGAYGINKFYSLFAATIGAKVILITHDMKLNPAGVAALALPI